MLMDHYALMDQNDGNSRALCYRISGGDFMSPFMVAYLIGKC